MLLKRLPNRMLCLASAAAVTLAASAVFAGTCGSSPCESDKPKAEAHENPSPYSDKPDVATLAGQADSLTMLLTLVEKAGLTDALRAEGPITVFAPTDRAMGKINAQLYESLLQPKNRDTLRKVLLGHVAKGRLTAREAIRAGSVKTLAGTYLYLHRNPRDEPMANDAIIAKADLHASNGVVHVIDTVLVPKPDLIATARAQGNFKTFLTAVKAAGLTETLRKAGPLTILAPTDEAFAELGKDKIAELLQPESKDKLAEILRFHVVPGWKHTYDKQGMDYLPTLQGGFIPIYSPSAAHWKVRLGGASIERMNVDASNGVLHAIDRVLMPKPSILKLAAEDGRFDTLLTALKAADLDGRLTAGGPVTVFAPTDEAFAALPDGALEKLVAPEGREKLTAILKYHVVPGVVQSEEILGRPGIRFAQTLHGGKLEFTVDDGKPSVGGASVIQADIEGGDGMIHVIDRVLLPPAKEPARKTKTACSK
jgi:uncharacterized surface protein with fasciclin (FAS1) repeats